jgi:hypothetical protein
MLLLTDKSRKIMGEWHKSWVENFPWGRAILTKSIALKYRLCHFPDIKYFL